MRSFLKTLVLALVVVFTVSAGSISAQGNGDGQWKKVAFQNLPVKVKTGYRKLFTHSKVSKVEKSGSGATVVYRLTIRRKGKPEVVLFDGQGHSKS